MAHLKKPFFIYGDSVFYPDVGHEDLRTPKTVERFDHVAASGKTIHYLVGSRDFIENTFRWQSSIAPAGNTFKDQWETFWDSIKDGTQFWYVDDTPKNKVSAALNCNTTVICGDNEDDAPLVETKVVVDQPELNMQEEVVDGYWSVRLRMREVV